MEESIEASMNRDLHSDAVTSSSSSSFSSEEESGWTTYFEEFIASQNKQLVAMEEQNRTSSNVSDASSHAAVMKEATSVSCKRLRLKKRKATGISFAHDDDALEDTASSPVNSPKVSGMDDSPKEDAGGINSEEKGFDNEKYGELKKKGLCLVPLSMFVDFQGH